MNERIRELRKRKGLNQTEFGAKLGLSQRAVANMESEGGTVTERNFDAICKAFNVNPEWLRHGVGEVFLETRESLLQSVVAEFDLTEGEAALMKTFLELPAEYRAGVLKWAENFARTMAAQLNVDYPLREEMSRKPDSELTRAEKHAMLDKEFDEAEKRKTLLVSTGTSGSKEKFGIKS